MLGILTKAIVFLHVFQWNYRHKFKAKLKKRNHSQQKLNHGLTPSPLKQQAFIDAHWLDVIEDEEFSMLNPVTVKLIANVSREDRKTHAVTLVPQKTHLAFSRARG